MRRLAGHVKHNAVAYLALFISLGGTGAYAANTIRTADIVDDQVTSPDVRDDTLGFGGLNSQDLGPGSVGSSEVKDGSLQAADIAQPGGSHNFLGDIGLVPAHDCVRRQVSGIDAAGDHLLLTADWSTAREQLSYSIEYLHSFETAYIKVCNPTNNDIDDGQTYFNLLVIAH